jgi:hypothetical protein
MEISYLGPDHAIFVKLKSKSLFPLVPFAIEVHPVYTGIFHYSWSFCFSRENSHCLEP